MNAVYRGLLGTVAFMSTASLLFGQNGIVFTGQGPVNRSMGGASTAAPLDSLGAIYWNPATISALNSEMAFGIEVLWPHSTLSSSVHANVFGLQRHLPSFIQILCHAARAHNQSNEI